MAKTVFSILVTKDFVASSMFCHVLRRLYNVIFMYLTLYYVWNKGAKAEEVFLYIFFGKINETVNKISIKII